MEWIAKSLLSRPTVERTAAAFNPCPSGHIVPGCSTDMALRFMRCAPKGRWYSYSELALGLGRSKGEVDWALRQLRTLGLVEAIHYQAPGRPQTLRYRLALMQEQGAGNE